MLLPESSKLLIHPLNIHHPFLAYRELFVVARVVNQALLEPFRLQANDSLHSTVLGPKELKPPGPKLDVVPNPAVLHPKRGEKPTLAGVVQVEEVRFRS